MPPQYDRIPTLAEVDEIRGLIEQLNIRFDEINRVFAEIGVAEVLTRGTEGMLPQISNILDMQRNRIVDVERSRQPRDVVTRIELEEMGLFTNDGAISFSDTVNFAEGATVTGGATGSTSITTVTQVIEATITATEGLVPTNVSGDRVDIRDDGVNGTIEGTLLMARNEHGRADFLRMEAGCLVSQDKNILTMLHLIYEELRRLNGVQHTGHSESETG